MARARGEVGKLQPEITKVLQELVQANWTSWLGTCRQGWLPGTATPTRPWRCSIA